MKTYIKKWASYLGISLDSLAEDSGVSSKIIQKWFNEELTPSVAQLSAISKVMNVPMDNLINKDPTNMDFYDDSFVSSDDDNKENEDLYDPGKDLVFTIALDEWMESAGITSEDICESSGIPINVIESWINHDSNPTILQAKVLADLFGIPLDDLMSKTPKNFYEDYLKIHVLETTNFKTAVRAQNYFRSNGIENECVAIQTEKYILFILRYDKLVPLTMFDFFKISINPVYRDRREKEVIDEEKYSGMHLVKAF